jgi:hypothetical protein
VELDVRCRHSLPWHYAWQDCSVRDQALLYEID